MHRFDDDQTDYSASTFKKLTITRATIHAKAFYGCTFRDCDFSETAFSACTFTDCTFNGCTLNMATVADSGFSGVTFRHCSMVGINWTEADWRSLLGGLRFEDCTLSHSTLFGLHLKGLVMTRCLAKNVDFAEAFMQRADFTETDFSEARFFHTDVTEADFTHAVNYSINAGVNTLTQAKFSLPEAVALLYGLDIVLVKDSDAVHVIL